MLLTKFSEDSPGQQGARFSPAALAVIVSIAVFILAAGFAGQAWAAGGTPVAYTANTYKNTVSVIDMDTNAIVTTITGIDSPTRIAVSPDSGRIYVTDSGSNEVTVIDTATNTKMAAIPVGKTPFGIALSPDGKTAYVTNNKDNTVSIVDTAAKKVTGTVNVGNGPYGIAVNPKTGAAYVINTNDNSVSVIKGGGAVATIAVGQMPMAGIAASPDGSRVYVANGNDNSVSIIDTATNAVVKTVNTGHTPIDIAISPDGASAYVANLGDQTISILRIADGTIQGSLKATYPEAIAFRPDGKVIFAVTMPKGNITVVDSATGAVKASIDVNALSLGVALVTLSAPDTTPPTTTLVLDGTTDANGAFIGEVACNLTAADDATGAGVNAIQFSLDGTNWIPYQSIFKLRNPGSTPFYYRATDKAGNTEKARVKVIAIVAAEAAVSPSPGPASPPVPANSSATSTPEATTRGPTPPQATGTAKPTSSGFEAVLAATGILGAGYFIVRRK